MNPGTSRTRNRRSVKEQERHARPLGDLSPVALVGSGFDGGITSWNRAATALLGWRALDVVGRRLADVLGCDVMPRSGGEPGAARWRTKVVSAAGLAVEVDVLVDGASYRYEASGQYMVALIPVAAVTVAGPLSSPRIDSWADAANIIRTVGGPVQCVALGLVGMEAVNSGYSRSTGDAVLREIAARLERAVGTGSHVVRIAGNQFVTISSSTAQVDPAELVQQVSQPVGTRLGSIRLGCYAGSALGDSASGLVVLDRADLAMRRAEARGVGTIERLPEDGQQRSPLHPRLSTLLIDAVARWQIGVVFQPVVELATGRTIEFEALARWRSTEMGDVDPTAFIEAAEDAGLIHELGRMVLAKSLDVVQTERLAGRWGHRRVSVNVSGVQLAHPDLPARILDALSSRDLPGEVLQLELTETRRIVDVGVAMRHLDEIRRAGVRVAVDDFGTGCANMSHLRDLPVHTVKIDKSFIAGACTSPVDAAVIRSIISLASELQLDVIAEGVESAEQHHVLCRLGCFAAQGFLYAGDREPADLYAPVHLPAPISPDPPELPAEEREWLLHSPSWMFWTPREGAYGITP
jgi:EAL domain-containing protein (putative c-di-GMP-specific phosphodiesterase class I)/GGDEF domain-containing protein